VETLDDEQNVIHTKRYLTLDDIYKDINISRYKIKQNASTSKIIKGFEKYRFYNEYHPAFKLVKNED
tara:strand:+ start:5319 stop:5519 length:201 start_codon:yes stop_codon:yes gene_type:complete